MKMYFLVYHVKPAINMENSGGLVGAFVSCWIEANSINEAKQIATGEIRLAKWELLELDDAYEIKKEDYSIDSDGWEFYQQALIDKWVLRFHTYTAE